MPFGERQKHESYGMVGISHISCGGGVSLFGSSIKHDRVIRLRVKRADVERSLHREWYHGHESIVEVEMSAAQFADFIMNPNIGDGVPCTIRDIEGERMEDPPYRGQNEIFNQELKADFSKALDDAKGLVEDATEMLDSKGPMKVADKKRLLCKLTSLVKHIESNMPFLHKQFTRSMDKTVAAAKAEIEAFYTSAVMKMGKKALEAGHKPEAHQIEE